MNSADWARLEGNDARVLIGLRVIRVDCRGDIGVGMECLVGTLFGGPFGCGAWNVRNGLGARGDTNGSSSCVIIGTLCSGA